MLFRSVVGDQAVTERARLLGIGAAGAVFLALLAFGLAVVVRRVSARRRERDVDDAARHVLAAVVDELMVRPTVAVLEDHRAVREATQRLEPLIGVDVLDDVVQVATRLDGPVEDGLSVAPAPSMSTAGRPRQASTV